VTEAAVAGEDETAVREAEIRALAALDQELACAPGFAAWLFRAALEQVRVGIDLPDEPRLMRATPGPVAPVDRVLIYDCGPLRIALALAVRLSPAARDVSCADRAGAELLESRRADLAFTVLLGGGPAADRFDAAIPLGRAAEAVAARAAGAQGELAARLNHAGAALSAAETASRAAARRVDDAGAERFRIEYLALLEELAPSLPPPDVAPPVLDVIEFGRDALPRWPFMPEARLVQHLRRGAASIRLPGWGADVDGLAHVMEPALRGTDLLLSAGPPRPDDGPPDALVVACAPRLDPARPIDEQFDAARDAALILRDLARWYESRRAAARYWAEFADPSHAADRGGRVRRDLRLA
jgi:hypothetical protein